MAPNADGEPILDWRRIPADALESHFNPRLASDNFERHHETFGRLSAAARADLPCRLDLRYGDGPLETLDFFPGPGPDAPLHVFIHGGYWRALDKSLYSCIAVPLVSAGAAVALLNYDLCPAVTVTDIVVEIRRAIAWLARRGAELGFDADRIALSGHSAGAHLAAMAIAHDWAAEGLPADLIKGASLVSGIYAPAPALHLPVNAEIGLTADVAHAANALLHPPRATPAIAVSAGGAEPPGWIGQSHAYVSAHRLPVPVIIVPGADHFTIKDEALDSGSRLFRISLAHLSLR